MQRDTPLVPRPTAFERALAETSRSSFERYDAIGYVAAVLLFVGTISGLLFYAVGNVRW